MNELCLIIDMLNDFRIGPMGNPRMEFIIPPMINFLNRKVSEGVKIFFISDNHEKDDSELKMFPEHAMKGTPGAMIIDELQKFAKKDNSNVIFKKTYSAFFGTSLADVILKEKPEKIYLIGVLTDICILHTAIDLFYLLEKAKLKTKVVIVRDCIESYDKPGHIADKKNIFSFEHMKYVLNFEIVEKQKML